MTTVATQDSKWFGAGYIFGTQTIAPGGQVAPSILLPSELVSIQEASVDISIKTVELRSALEDPEDVATSARKITGKIVTGRVGLNQLNWLVFGEPGGGNYVAGTKKLAEREPHVIPASGVFTVVVSNGATFYEDKGVYVAGSRLQFTPVTGVPLQGQYSYAPVTGTYTFNLADAGTAILISYMYTSPTGHTLTVNNLIMGSARPAFEALFQNPYDGDQELLLFACRVSKLGFPIKTEDYVKIDIEFMAFANSQGQVMQWLSSY
jgi:hypothetical protein